MPGSILQGGDQSKVGLDDLGDDLKRFYEFSFYLILSEVLLPPSSSKLVFISRTQIICSGQVTDRETVPMLPMSCGASERT